LRWLGDRCVAVCLALSLATPAGAVTLLGSDFLSPVQVWDPDVTFLGEALNPRLDLDGRVELQFLHARTGGTFDTVFVPQIDLQLNLQLTATQRVFALLRPLERGDRRPTLYRFGDHDGWTGRFQGEPEALFYEGQPFNWLSPNDRWPLDVSVAGGRIPFTLHNGLWFDNYFDGFSIAKNNIQLGSLSNLNVLYFLTRGQTQPGITLSERDRREQEKNLTGVDVNTDWGEYFVEASWAVGYDNGKVRDGRQDLDRHFWALSLTRTLSSDAGVAFRAMGSTPNATAGAGELFALEGQYGLWDTLLYATVFGATADWLPPSVQGSPLDREGILFAFDRLVPTPQLNPRAADTVGGVVGDVLNPRGWLTVTPEFGWLVDEHPDGVDQVGAGVQLQVDLSHLLIPGGGTAPMVRRGLLYGALARVTVVGIRNDDAVTPRAEYDYGVNVELVYEF
jgi:hypothetical protein